MSKLDQRTLERVGGPSWRPLKAAVLEISDILLGVSNQARSNLTTVYVKFERPDASVYAVMWLKKASEVVVGLSLPSGVDADRLHDAPRGMKYANLTRYFTVRQDDSVPRELLQWARSAFESEGAP